LTQIWVKTTQHYVERRQFEASIMSMALLVQICICQFLIQLLPSQ